MNGSIALLAHVGHVSEPDPPEPLGILDLDGDRDDRLGLRLASVDLVLDTADVGLIDLDMPGQPLPAGADHRRPVTVQHRPRRLVRAQSK
jgi:hypothetical protein